jgi:serine/threonine-protein kinase RsbW
MAGSTRLDSGGSLLMKRSLTASLAELPGLVEQAETSMAKAELPLEVGLNFALAFDEILTNLANHASTDAGRDVCVEVVVYRYADRVEATIWDNGPPFDLASIQPPDIEAGLDVRSLGGLGLFIVRNVMDEVMHDRLGGRNRLFLSKHLGQQHG